MIVLDSSAVIAILEKEPEGGDFLTIVDANNHISISAVSVLECSIRSYFRHRDAGIEKLNDFLVRGKIKIEPFNESQLALAVAAHMRFGKGINKAGLNFGDCASYALAKSLNALLLFKGNDFSETDIKRC